MSRFFDRGWATRIAAARTSPKLTLRRVVIWRGFYHGGTLLRNRPQLRGDIEKAGAAHVYHHGAVVEQAPLCFVGGIDKIGDSKTCLGAGLDQRGCVTH